MASPPVCLQGGGALSPHWRRTQSRSLAFNINFWLLVEMIVQSYFKEASEVKMMMTQSARASVLATTGAGGRRIE